MKSIQKDIVKPNEIPVNYIMDEVHWKIYYFEKLNLFFTYRYDKIYRYNEILVRVIKIGKNK